MHLFQTMVFTSAAFASGSTAWKMTFSRSQGCGFQFPDTVRDGEQGESLKCRTIIPDLKTMVFQSWSKHCRIEIWNSWDDCFYHDIDYWPEGKTPAKPERNVTRLEAKNGNGPHVLYNADLGLYCFQNIDTTTDTAFSYLCDSKEDD